MGYSPSWASRLNHTYKCQSISKHPSQGKTTRNVSNLNSSRKE